MARLMLQILLLFAVASMTFASRTGTSQISSLPGYALKVSKDGKDYDEDVSANIRDGTETFHLREASSGKDAGDIIYDLKRLTCKGNLKITPQTEVKLKAHGTLTDRSHLSREMVNLCAKLPIYQVTKDDSNSQNMNQTNDAEENADEAQLPAKHTKRIWKKVCKTVCVLTCYTKCSGWFCYPVCKPVCRKVCSWIFG